MVDRNLRNILSATMVVVGLGFNSANAFQITSGSFNSDGAFQLQFPANTNSYYVLYYGTNVSDITTPISTVSGVNGVGQLFDTNPPETRAFYRVRQLTNAESPVLTSLTPASATISPAATVHLTVNLDIPAPPGGAMVTLSLNPANAGTIPATVTVPAGMTSVSFDYVDGGVVSGATVTATLGASMIPSLITVDSSNYGLVINEIDYDQPGTSDAAEFVELYNGSDSSANLTNLALVFINGADSSEYLRVNLSGSLAAHGYLVVADSNVVAAAGAAVINFTNTVNIIQNGSPDGVALFDVANHQLVDALSYEGSITMAQINGEAGTFSLVEGTALSASDSNTTNGSLIRSPNGQDTGDADTDWKFTTTPTPGAANILSP